MINRQSVRAPTTVLPISPLKLEACKYIAAPDGVVDYRRDLGGFKRLLRHALHQGMQRLELVTAAPLRLDGAFHVFPISSSGMQKIRDKTREYYDSVVAIAEGDSGPLDAVSTMMMTVLDSTPPGP